MKNKRAFTLTEVLIAVAIIVILAGIVTFALVSKSKAKALETVSRARLRTTAQAIQIYMLDWDQKPPRMLEALPKGVEYWSAKDSRRFGYLGSWEEAADRGALWALQFDPNLDYILRDGSFKIHNGEWGSDQARNVFGDLISYRYPILEVGQDFQVLAAKIDGSVRYVWYEEAFGPPEEGVELEVPGMHGESSEE